MPPPDFSSEWRQQKLLGRMALLSGTTLMRWHYLLWLA
jgi:hypothetical protein